MSAITHRWRTWLVWFAPFAALALVIGWETDWLRAFNRIPAPEVPPAPQPVAVAVLPDYAIAGGADALRAITERTLFNPTRRPAPPALAEAAKTQLRRGQFQLTGTTVFDNKGVAYLKETAGGKARSVKLGETINGMLVAEVKTDRVKLTLGDESEELLLKLAVGPKTTIQPVVPGTVAPGAPVTARPAAAPTAAAAPSTGAPAAQPQGTPLSLAARRRAARAAEAAAGQAQAGATSGGSNVPAPVVDPGAASSWQSMQQRYQQRNPGQTNPSGGK